MKSRILYEDKNIIVVHKPAGIATQTARVGQRDMVSEVTGYLAAEAAEKSADSMKSCNTGTVGKKPVGSVQPPYVGVIHRLDQPVEGILVFAKDKQSAAALSRQVAEAGEKDSHKCDALHTNNLCMEKYYYAIVCGEQFPDEGELVDYLLKDGKTNTSRIVPKEVKDAKEARLSYRILDRRPVEAADGTKRQLALAEIHLQTGRHHQIRVQMSRAGMSLLGDHKYADELTIAISGQMKVKEIALCACRLEFTHPVSGERMKFEITPEGRSFQFFSV